MRVLRHDHCCLVAKGGLALETQIKDQKHYKYEPKTEVIDHILIMGSLILPYILIPLSIWRGASNQLNYRKGFTYKLISFQLIASFVSYILYGFFLNSIFSYILAVFATSFVLLVIAAGFYSNRSERYIKLVDQYRQVIFIHQIHHIQEIAEQVRQTELGVAKDLEYLMDNNHFPRGTIVDGKLMFERNMNEVGAEQIQSAQVTSSASLRESDRRNVLRTINAPLTPSQPKNVKCSGCGSNVLLNHMEAKECEYCGILLING